MDAADRGSRHICPDCATKYYDLNKAVVACPKCGAKPPAPKFVRSGRPPSTAPRGNNGMNIRRYPQ